MRKFILLLIILISFGCVDSSKNEIKRTELINSTVFEFDSLIVRSPYELETIERDSVIVYKYKNLEDSTKNKNFRYLKFTDQLLAGPFEFARTVTHNYPEIGKFHYYNSDPGIMDGMGPVIFNSEYGVFGFDNGMGTQYYFTNEKTNNLVLPVLYKWTE